MTLDADVEIQPERLNEVGRVGRRRKSSSRVKILKLPLDDLKLSVVLTSIEAKQHTHTHTHTHTHLNTHSQTHSLAHYQITHTHTFQHLHHSHI